MIRGTTAQFKFKLPCTVDELSSVSIVFWQNGNKNSYLPIRRGKDQCVKAEADDCCLCVSLDANDTMKFSDKLKAQVQLRGQYGSTVFASRTQSITVYPINEVAIEPEYPDANEEGWIILDGETIGGDY